MTFFMIFSEIFKKKINVEKFQKFEDLNFVLESVRVLSGVAKLSSEYGCSNS